MNLSWLVALIFTIILSSLALNMDLLNRLIIAIILILLAIICYIASSYFSLKSKFQKEQKAKNKRNKEFQDSNEQLKKSIINMSELSDKLREIVDRNNINDNEIDNFLNHQTQTSEELTDFLDKSEKEETIKININSKEKLLSFLDKLESGKIVIFYEDDDREASIKYGYDGMWEFYYFRKGFETTIRGFSLDMIIDNNYFSNAISWIEPSSIDRIDIKEYKTYVIDYNTTYDMIVIENYPKDIYHYVILKEKGEHVADLCDDCHHTGKHHPNWVSIHKSYPLNFQVAKKVGFNIDYLSEKFRISEVEAHFMAKVLKNNFGLKFKELEE